MDREICNMGKLLLLTINEREEKAIDKIVLAIADNVQLEAVQTAPAPVLSFPRLEIRQSQRRVFRNGEELHYTEIF